MNNGHFTNETDSILFEAMVTCGEEADIKNGTQPDDHSMHRFLSGTPTIVLIVQLRLQLESLGYELKEKRTEMSPRPRNKVSGDSKME